MLDTTQNLTNRKMSKLMNKKWVIFVKILIRNKNLIMLIVSLLEMEIIQEEISLWAKDISEK
jgi:sugar phosphate permease